MEEGHIQRQVSFGPCSLDVGERGVELEDEVLNRGVLSPQDANEIYENALLMIEMQQGSDPAVQHVYEAARELIEAHLRPE